MPFPFFFFLTFFFLIFFFFFVSSRQHCVALSTRHRFWKLDAVEPNLDAVTPSGILVWQGALEAERTPTRLYSGQANLSNHDWNSDA